MKAITTLDILLVVIVINLIIHSLWLSSIDKRLIKLETAKNIKAIEEILKERANGSVK